MRILSTDAEGKCVLNPSDIRSLLNNSVHKGGGLVVCGSDIVVSTAYTCHTTMMEQAGMELVIYSLDNDCDPALATFRGGIAEGRMNIDILNESDADVETNIESLRIAYEFLTSHRKLRHHPELVLHVFDEEYVLTHEYDGATLVDKRVPAASYG